MELFLSYWKIGKIYHNYSLPVVISHQIKALKPAFFWMGGGHPDIKMRLAFSDFVNTYPDEVLVEDITY